MLSKFFAHLRAQWMGALALFLVLGGGVAYAGATITGSDVVNGSLTTADYKNNDIRGADVLNAGTGGLTGQDIKDKSGVDTCSDGFLTERAGDLCFRVANLALDWDQALRFCGDL